MIELTKDFQKLCSDAQVTTIAEGADYTVTLNHIEHGFGYDNLITVSNKEGDVLGSREKGRIQDKVKIACDLILSDWRKGNHSPASLHQSEQDFSTLFGPKGIFAHTEPTVSTLPKSHP